MTPIRRTMSLLRAIVALVVMLGLAIGVPLLLTVMFGNPIPGQWSWDSPLTNDAILGLLACLAWVFWAQMVLCLVVEIVVEIRLATGRSADWLSRVPGTFGGQQALARVLVQAVVAVGITSAAAATVGGPPAARADVGAPSPTQTIDHARVIETSQPVAERHADQPRRVATTTVEVHKGDSLWSIAERHLGAGERWREIAELNDGRRMAEGERFAEAHTIQPGWTLLIPEPDLPKQGGQVANVERGDTLWEIADRAYGDGETWPRIYQSNRAQIVDPDLIYPGQELRVPGSRSNDHPDLRGGETASEAPEAGPRTSSNHGVQLDAPPAPTTTNEPSWSPESQPAPTPAPESQELTEVDVQDGDETEQGAGTLARALAGGGALLAGGLLIAFVARRRAQFRVRRSGRTIPRTPPDLVAVESAVRSAGSAGGVAVQFLDLALRDLASRAARLPEVAAARLADDVLELVLAEPCWDAPEGWTTAQGGLRWILPRDVDLAAASSLAPYPTLAALGVDPDGGTWLLDLERAGIVQLAGPREACADLARFFAAELSTNRWSDDVDILVAGIGRELVPLNPNRLEPIEALDIDRLIKKAHRIAEIHDNTGHDVLAGRRDGAGDDGLMPTVVVADAAPRANNQPALAEFATALDGNRCAAALVTIGIAPIPNALVVMVDDAGQATLPWAGGITINRLTQADAQALGATFASTEQLDDEPMPNAAGDGAHDKLADAAGALRVDLTEPREDTGNPGSLLPADDALYLERAATTSEDLASLAPNSSPQARSAALEADPDLDGDVAEWFDDELRRPRLCLLGPVELRVAGERPEDVRRRVAYFTEIAAYLVCHPHGATAQQLANDFGIQTNTLHSRMLSLRKWLGEDPKTGTWHVPEATMSRPGTARGVGNYEITGLLCDADLFRQLRTRSQARGAEGMPDLVTALRLVTGPPFDQQRSAGYGWLAETATDHHLTAAIVDVAHVVASQALASDAPKRAAWAAEQAILAAPYEDKPRLDLAKAQSALGHVEEARAYVAAEVFNRSDDDHAPPDPTPRVSELAGRLADVRRGRDTAEHLEPKG